MATFGNTGVGTTFTSTIENVIKAGQFTMGPVGGTANSLSMYLSRTGTPSGVNFKLKGALYLASDDSLVAQTNEGIISDSFAIGFQTLNFSGSPALTASVDYYLAMWCSGVISITVSTLWDGSGGLGFRTLSRGYTTWSGQYPDPSGTSVTDADGLASIYCDYTETSAGGQPIRKRFGAVPHMYKTQSGLFVPAVYAKAA
jgi:hypothetical protein